MGADKIGALAHGLARQPHRLVVVACDELRVSGDAMIDAKSGSRGLRRRARNLGDTTA